MMKRQIAPHSLLHHILLHALMQQPLYLIKTLQLQYLNLLLIQQTHRIHHQYIQRLGCHNSVKQIKHLMNINIPYKTIKDPGEYQL